MAKDNGPLGERSLPQPMDLDRKVGTPLRGVRIARFSRFKPPKPLFEPIFAIFRPSRPRKRLFRHFYPPTRASGAPKTLIDGCLEPARPRADLDRFFGSLDPHGLVPWVNQVRFQRTQPQNRLQNPTLKRGLRTQPRL